MDWVYVYSLGESCSCSYVYQTVKESVLTQTHQLFSSLYLFFLNSTPLPSPQLIRQALIKFTEHAVLDSSYFLCKQEGILAAARLLAATGLSLRDTYVFCMAPASATDPHLMGALLLFAQRYAAGAPVVLDLALPAELPRNPLELRRLETAHAIVNLWLWLSYRFDEEAFPGREEVQRQAAAICDTLHRGLEKVTRLTKARHARGGRDAGRRAGRAPVDLLLQRPSPEHERMLQPFEAVARLLKEDLLDDGGERAKRRPAGRALQAA